MKNKISLLMNNYSQDKMIRIYYKILPLKDQLDILLCGAIKNKALLANNSNLKQDKKPLLPTKN